MFWFRELAAAGGVIVATLAALALMIFSFYAAVTFFMEPVRGYLVERWGIWEGVAETIAFLPVVVVGALALGALYVLRERALKSEAQRLAKRIGFEYVGESADVGSPVLLEEGETINLIRGRKGGIEIAIFDWRQRDPPRGEGDPGGFTYTRYVRFRSRSKKLDSWPVRDAMPDRSDVSVCRSGEALYLEYCRGNPNENTMIDDISTIARVLEEADRWPR